MISNMNIIKGYIIPKRIRGEEITYTRIFTDSEASELYNKYVDFLKRYIRIYTQLSGKDKLRNSNDIREFLNSLVFYIKSFTHLEVMPTNIFGEDRILPLSSSSMLRSYIFVDDELYKSDKLYHIISIIENLTENMNRLKDINDMMEELKEDLFEFPADTRPGYNTSSLFLHILTVSAIAVAIYKSRERFNGDSDLQILRLVSLFHDVGKMRDWHKHETISSNLLMELLKEFCEDEALDIVKKSADIISRKCEDKLYDIFKSADRLASSLDRMTLLLPKLMPNGWKKIEERVRMKGYGRDYINNWKFWDEFSMEEIKEFTEEFCMNASRINGDNPVFDIETDIKTSDVIISRLDFQGIQSYIYSKMIRVMNGASRIVDIITTVLIPFYLVKQESLVAESILYYGGGNITLIMPSDHNLESKELNNCREYFSKYGIHLNYGSSLFYSNFAQINSEIDRNLTENKLLIKGQSLEARATTISANIGMLCKSCGIKEITISNIDEQHKEKGICLDCMTKWKVGDEYHFSKRIDTLLGYKDGVTKLLENILEYIAGHTIQEIMDNRIKEYKNIACMKIDGNLMGQFMASSISITDAYERSIRIDQSLKKALQTFLLKLDELAKNDSSWSNREYIKRIGMGIMYIGGDDAALLVPSTIAIPLSLCMINEYYLNMGKKSTLSIGIAVGKPKHPIQLLKEASEYLLDEITKDKVREYAYKVHSCMDKDYHLRGALAFWIADGSQLNRRMLNYITSYLSNHGISSQPYYLIDSKNDKSIYRLLKIIDAANTDYDYTNLLNMLDDNLLELKKEYLDRLKELRRDILSSLQVNINGESDLILNIIFATKEEKNSINKETYGMLVNNLLQKCDKGYIFPLYDLYQLLKVIGVE